MPYRRLAEERFRELCNEYAAVARCELAGTGVSLLACDDAGRPRRLEVITVTGEVLADGGLDLLAGARASLMRSAEQATEHLIAGVALRVQAGEDVNLAAIAREANLSRQTLYSRLAELGIKP